MGDSLCEEIKRTLACRIFSCIDVMTRFPRGTNVPCSERRNDETMLGHKLNKAVRSQRRQECDKRDDHILQPPLRPALNLPTASFSIDLGAVTINSPGNRCKNPNLPVISTFLFGNQPNTFPSFCTPPPSSSLDVGLVSSLIPHGVNQLGQTIPLNSEPQTHILSFQHSRYQPSIPRRIRSSSSCRVVGDASLQIYRISLPPHLIHLLDEIVWSCERHAATLPRGWYTDLYSLTKQDIALRDIPYQYHACKPITDYIRKCMVAVFGVSTIKMDRNQPHILRYSAEDGHTGVELHHDKCDITANLCLSNPRSYFGGGTYFPAADEVVKLDFGEFILHPGALIHAGMNITEGTRHLLVIFAKVK